MPVNPYTWQTDDFITAYRLNSELRQTNGNPFLPNGPGFHCRRPVWKSIQVANPASPGASVVAYAENASKQWLSVADTGALVGAKYDPAGVATAAGQAIPNGETATSPGGLLLLTGNVNWSTSSTAASFRTGSGAWITGTGSLITQGTAQPSNTVETSAPWFLDLIDPLGFGGGSNPAFTLWYQNTVGSIAWNSQNTDGSGKNGRMAAFWAGQSTGTKVTAVPSIPGQFTGSTAMSSASLNSWIQQAMYLANMPPALKVLASTSTSLTSGTAANISYAATPLTDTYGAFTTSSGSGAKYTTPLDGLYLCYACTSFAGTIAAGVQGKTGFSFNSGSAVWGPSSIGNGTSGFSTVKVGVHHLAAGTTITHCAQLGATGSTNGGTNPSQSCMVVLYLGPAATSLATPAPVVPDTSYLFKAGTPAASAPGILNSYLVNDLTFLAQRPYLLALQNTAQTGIAQGTGTIVHLDATPSDPYSGWTSGAANLYTAQRAGWYLAVQETQMAAPSLTATPSNLAGFQLSPAGGTAFDWYQQQNAYTGAGGGAAAVGLYYLRAGDTIAPAIASFATSSTTTSTISGTATPTHFELVWISS